MTQAELLRYLVDVLEALEAEYMIGGSQAAMYYGEPRLTRDVGAIVALRLEHSRRSSAGSRPPSSPSTNARPGTPSGRPASSTSSTRALA